MKPFKNKIIESKIEDIHQQIKMESPAGREARLEYMKSMLKEYQSYEERYPNIERDLERGIREVMKPVDPKLITSLQSKARSLEGKL